MPISLREDICRVRRVPLDTDVLLGRAELLLADDRRLLDAVLVRGQTIKTLAELMGVSKRRLGNRIRKLIARLSSRDFLLAARVLSYLPREDAMVAQLRYCAGLSERKLASRLGVSSYAVRRRLDRIEAQIVTIRRLRRVGGSSPDGAVGLVGQEGEMNLV